MDTPKFPLEVLVVDDDPNLVDILADTLSSDGASVESASSGQEAIDKYNAKFDTGYPYRAVFTDLNMPGVSGVEVVRHVKSLHPETLVYVITGAEATLEYQSLAAKLQAQKPDAAVQKPFNAEVLTILLDYARIRFHGAIRQPRKD